MSSATRAFLTVVVVLLCASTEAGTFTAFGPEVYRREEGSPATITKTFALARPSLPYTLQVYNGGLEDAEYEKASSTVVWINGVQVLSPNDLNRTTAFVEKRITVALQASNTIAVQVRGKPGGAVAIRIVGTAEDQPTITATATPAANANGWNRTNVTVEFTCSSASGIASCPEAMTVTAEGARQAVTGTTTDSLGNTASVTVTLNIDKTAPVVSAIAVPEANDKGWHKASLVVDFTCTDLLSGVDECAADVPMTTEGQGQAVTGTGTDRAGNSGSAALTINIDRTPPVITAAAVPPPNAHGWNNQSVAVSYQCSDGLSGVASCSESAQLSAEGPGQSVTGLAADRAGNTAQAQTTASIDRTPPSITAAAVPAANEFGWHRADAGVTFTCEDALSGVASCPDARAVTTEGEGQAVDGTAVDRAGNQANASASISLDRTPPVLETAVVPEPNANGWNRTEVAVTFQCTDGLSGVAACPDGATLGTEGRDQVVPGVARDRAGNEATAERRVSIDRTPPAIEASPSSAPNEQGWYNGEVSIGFTCSDALSGVDTCPAAQAVGGEGIDQAVEGLATDRAGNTATSSAKVNVDRTPPVIQATASPGANAHGWNNADVTVSFSCTDALSGVKTCAAPVAFTSEGAGQQATGTATDQAGNTASAGKAVSIDRTVPAIEAAAVPEANAAGWNREDVTVSYNCSDALSGIAFCSPTEAFTDEGAHAATGIAVDRAGNRFLSPSRIVSIDRTPPQVTSTAAPPANERGWNRTDVTVSFACTDAISGVASCSAPQTISAEGEHVLEAAGVDLAGNTAPATAPVKIDRTPPEVTASLSPPPNAAGWNRTDVAVSFIANDALSGVASVTPPAVVSAEGTHVRNGQAEDLAGNLGRGSARVSLDRTAPVVTLVEPDEAAQRQVPAVRVAGTVQETNRLESITVNGHGAGTGPSFQADVALSPGPQSVQVVATDLAGNAGEATRGVTYRPAPTIRIESPADLTAVGTTPVTVSGTVDPGASVRVGLTGVVAVVGANGRFQADGVPLREGGNVITAVATDATGSTATDSVTLVLDTARPYVAVLSPSAGSLVATPRVTVSGIVNDVTTGTVNRDQARVVVNGVDAEVAFRTFLARDVPLVEGPNTLSVVATDSVGNTDTATVTVRYQPPTGPTLQKVSGDAQEAPIRSALPSPLVVKVTGAQGEPLPSRTVVFRVAEGDGVLSPPEGAPARGLAVQTDAAGQASVRWTLGGRAGAAGNRVEATSPGLAGGASFLASGRTAPPALISMDAGNQQRGAAGQALPWPFVAVVTDEGHNRLSGVPVTFRVTSGGGHLSGATERTVLTDSDGRALTVLSLGPAPGASSNVVVATVPGAPERPAAFTATALNVGNAAATRLSGLVVDNANQPILGVTARVRGTAVAAQTNEAGRFQLASVPVGDVHLTIDGSTTQRPGSWPSLEYELVTVAGADNTLGMPVYLLPLDLGSSIFVDETKGATLTLPEYPGFSLKVHPNSARFPDGTRRGTISVTAVHPDKVPMVPNFGQQPRFIVTIQPPGVAFDPPAEVTHPNVDGLAPGEVTELYSFDHDMGSFVATGTARVSEDGTVIASLPGGGVLKGGWHCGGNPNQTGTAANCPDCQACNPADGSCVNNDSQALEDETPPGDCNVTGCKDGSPSPIPASDPAPNEDTTDCTRPTCTILGKPDTEPDDNETPPPDPANPENPTDCKRWGCKDGEPGSVNADFETPPPDAAGNCMRKVCSDGESTDDRDDSDVPADPADNCRRGVCKLGTPDSEIDDSDRKQTSSFDCWREVCVQGVPDRVRDYSEPGCKPPDPQACPVTPNPVQLLTGNAFFTHTDGAVGGQGGLVFTRTYNSYRASLGEGGAFGRGWTHPFERAVTVLRNGSLRLDLGNGTEVYFADRGAGRYEPTQGKYGRTTIERAGDRITHRLRSGAREVYDGSGRLIEEIDPVGNRTQYERDSAGRLVRVTAASGRSFSLSYDAAGRIRELIGPSGPFATYSYDSRGFLTEVVYPDGGGYRFTYNDRGQNLEVKDLGGVILESHEYEGHRAVSSARGGGVDKRTMWYLPGKTIVRDAAGEETVYEWIDVGGWEELGRLSGPCSSCGVSGGDVQSWTYDREGRVTSHTDGAGTRVMTYNDKGDLASETNAAGETTTYTYTYGPDDDILERIVTGPISRRAETYGPAGLTSSTETVTDSETRTTRITYDEAGRIVGVTDPGGETVALSYDARGDLTTITDALGQTTSLSYDALGRRATVTDPLGNKTRLAYDARSRLSAVTNPDGTSREQVYDRGGRLILTQDELARPAHLGYDATGRLTTAAAADGGVTRAGYDLMSRITSITDAEQRTTRFEYDAFGRPAKEIDPAGGETVYSYDSAGRLLTRKDRRGIDMIFAYDAAGRLRNRTSSDGTVAITYGYDAEGRLVTTANDADVLSFTRDRAGQVRSVTSSRQPTLAYEYDARGNRRTVSLDGDVLLTYEHDRLSRFVRMRRASAEFVVSYDEASRRTALRYPNGVSTSYSYDVRSQTTSIQATLGSDLVSRAGYSYDPVGNRMEKRLVDHAEAYRYDLADRLTNVQRNGAPVETYSFDRVGNRLAAVSGTAWQYDQRNRLIDADGVTFTYDPDGNLLTRTEAGITTNYQWNADNQLMRVTKADAEVATFKYDPLGRRIEKVAGGKTHRYAYDGVDIIRETIADGTTARVYTYLHGPGIDEPLAREDSSGVLTYYHADALGSIVKMTDQGGAVVQTRQYDAWGTLEAGADQHGYSYTGREWDPEIGLYYYRARYYDPKAGRFLSEDPIGFAAGVNFYAYVDNSPTNMTDPSGLAGHGKRSLTVTHAGQQYTKQSTAASVQAAIEDASKRGMSPKHIKALEGLLKVIRRGGAMVLAVVSLSLTASNAEACETEGEGEYIHVTKNGIVVKTVFPADPSQPATKVMVLPDGTVMPYDPAYPGLK